VLATIAMQPTSAPFRSASQIRSFGCGDWTSFASGAATYASNV
jgi:hypothetical protein